MKFGEKVRDLRTQKNMTQSELANAIGVSPRAVFYYEKGEGYPRHREVYTKLAGLFGVDTNYLLTEDEEFITEAGMLYGRKGMSQAQVILEQASALFAGGELSEEDELAFMHDMQKIYFDSKERAKKFSPKKRSEKKGTGRD
jgi:transcriptional regulator with XRE-family HTH domain